MRFMFAVTIFCAALWLFIGFWLGWNLRAPTCVHTITEDVVDFGEWREVHDL